MLKRKHDHTPRDDFIRLPIETYGCLHYCFDSLLTTCVQATIAHLQSFFSSCNVYFLLLVVVCPWISL
jgi:hypothetical protein